MRNVDLVLGLGEVGKPISDLLSERTTVVGIDLKKSLSFGKLDKKDHIEMLHICIGHGDAFVDTVVSHAKRYVPEAVVIHSTVKPYTTRQIQSGVGMPVIYSPVRGLHKQMLSDLKTYTKYFASYQHDQGIKAKTMFQERFKHSKNASSPHLLEFSKILVDTSYYGWLITYAQITNEICMNEGLDYDELWDFADEIHKRRGDRPKMRPGFIGGHCVIPNARLVDSKHIRAIITQNDRYAKEVLRQSLVME